MKRIFILTNDMNGGGAEKVLLTLLRHIPRKAYQITLGMVYHRGPHLVNIPPDIPVRYLFDSHSEHTTALIRKDPVGLYQRIAPSDSDIEIAFLEGNATKILSKSTNHTAKKIAWIHINLNLYHYTSSLYQSDEEEMQSYYAFDRLVFVSNGVQSGFEARFGSELRYRSVVQYNPIDSEDVIRLSQAFQVPKRQTTVCASGRLVPQKGFQRLLETVRRLQMEGVRFDLWILGEGSELENLLAQTTTLPQCDAVSFLGFRANPYPFMRAADIFVCSSFVEGLSLVIGEALILGRRIVSTDCCGTREALQDGAYGMLVGNDTDSLFRGLRSALNAGGECHFSEARFAPYDLRIQFPRLLALLDSL